jgi:hypothetical protein
MATPGVIIFDSDIRKQLRGVDGVTFIVGDAVAFNSTGKNVVPYRVERITRNDVGVEVIKVLINSYAIETSKEDGKKIYAVYKDPSFCVYASQSEESKNQSLSALEQMLRVSDS